MKKILTILFAAGFAAVSFAQMPAPPSPEAAKENMKKMFEAHKVLKEKYPQEMQDIRKMREDAGKMFRDADRKFAELAQKEKLDLPCVKRLERQQKMEAFNKKYEKELAEIKAAKKAGWEADKKFRELLKKEGLECPEKKWNKGPKDGKKFSGRPAPKCPVPPCPVKKGCPPPAPGK